LRKVALAITLTLLLSLANAPTHLSSTPPGSSPQDAGLGYAPEATDFVYPVGAPRIAPTFDDTSPNGYTITQMFNNSCDPAQGQGFYTAGQYFCGHTGVDLSDKADGGVVRAVANGLVVAASYNSTYGEMVRIQHLLPDGTYVYSQYEHMEEGSLLVTVGQIVTMSQNIGLVGATGFVTGPHLHFEVKSINADGVGYTFGNPALIIGYVEPISYVAAHTAYLAPTATPTLPAPTDTPAVVTDTATVVASANTGATSAVGTDASATPDVSVTAPLTSALAAAASSGGEQQGVLNRFYSRYHDYVQVTSDGMALNVRAGSGFDYPPLNSVRKGARLGYLGMTGNGWVRVALPGDVTGYVVRQWVQGDVLPKLPPSSYGDYKAPFVSVLDTRYPARTGPAMHDAPFEPLRLGEKLAFLGTNSTAPSWTRVVLPSGREAWVLNWYLSRPPAQPAKAGRIIPAVSRTVSRTTTPAPAFVSSYVMTTADGVRLRQGPRLGAQLIETLQQGARLSLHGYHVSWANVTTSDGTEGYVLASFLGASSSAASASKATHTQPAPAAAPAGHAPALLPAAQAAHGPRPHVVSTATILPAHMSGSANGITVQTRPSTDTTASPHQTTTVPAAVVPAAVIPAAAHVVVDVPAANLHAAPSRKATVVLSAQRHTALILRATSGDWLQVQTSSGATAWIMRDLTSSR